MRPAMNDIRLNMSGTEPSVTTSASSKDTSSDPEDSPKRPSTTPCTDLGVTFPIPKRVPVVVPAISPPSASFDTSSPPLSSRNNPTAELPALNSSLRESLSRNSIPLALSPPSTARSDPLPRLARDDILHPRIANRTESQDNGFGYYQSHASPNFLAPHYRSSSIDPFNRLNGSGPNGGFGMDTLLSGLPSASTASRTASRTVSRTTSSSIIDEPLKSIAYRTFSVDSDYSSSYSYQLNSRLQLPQSTQLNMSLPQKYPAPLPLPDQKQGTFQSRQFSSLMMDMLPEPRWRLNSRDETML